MKRILLLILALSCVFLAVACNGEGDTSIKLVVNEEVMMSVDTEEAGELKLSLPDSRRVSEFVGWRAQKGEETIFLPAGAIYAYAQGENTVFEPVYVGGYIDSKADMSYDPTAHGITMSAVLDAAEWEALKQFSPDASCGVLTVLKSDLDAVGGVFTHGALAAASLPVNDLASLNGVASEGGMMSFVALLANIPSENYAKSYTGIAYANITYTDGSTAYHYFAYGANGAPIDSIRNVASNKLSNMTAEEKDALTDEQEKIFNAYLLKFYVYVEKDYKSPGKISLDSNRYEVKAIYENEKEGSENEALWKKIANLLPISHERALYITMKDGTAMNEYNVVAVTYTDGTAISAQRYFPDLKNPRYTVAFFEGALIIGYSDFSPNV